MTTCWNSVDCVQTVTTWLRGLSIVLPLLGAVAALVSFVYSNRAEILKAPRKISEAQRTLLVERLKGAAGSHYDIGAVVSDPESMQFAQQILEVLIEAGWTGRQVPSLLQATKRPFGVLIAVKSDDAVQPAAQLLLDALRTVAFTDTYLTHDFAPQGDAVVTIRVGSKLRSQGP